MRLVLLFVSLLMVPQLALGSEASLTRFFNDVTTMRANFEQRVTDESGMTLESTSGVLSLSRPGKFRWNYQGDDPGTQGLQIISDGTMITFYEPDLETANRRSFKDAIEQVPTMVLVQSGGDLDKHFSITDFGLTDNLSWVALKPLDNEATYRELMLGFAGETINSIVLMDGLGNETRLVLSNVQRNIDLDEKVFEFDPPDGVDVIE